VIFQDGVQNGRRNIWIAINQKLLIQIDDLGVYPYGFFGGGGGKEHMKNT